MKGVDRVIRRYVPVQVAKILSYFIQLKQIELLFLKPLGSNYLWSKNGAKVPEVTTVIARCWRNHGLSLSFQQFRHFAIEAAGSIWTSLMNEEEEESQMISGQAGNNPATLRMAYARSPEDLPFGPTKMFNIFQACSKWHESLGFE